MNDVMDRFKTGSGLADSMDFQVQEAIFAYDAAYNNGQTPQLILSGVMDGTTPMTEKWAVGGKGTWIVEDGGARVVHKSGGKAVFNEKSAYGKFINGFVGCEGAEAALASRPDADPTIAATWEGLSFHLERTSETFKITEDGEQKEIQTSTLVPTAILLGDGATASSTPAAAAPVAAAPAEAVVIPDANRETLTKLALANPTFEAFIDAAYAIDGIIEPGYQAHVDDDSPAGFHALAIAAG